MAWKMQIMRIVGKRGARRGQNSRLSRVRWSRHLAAQRSDSHRCLRCPPAGASEKSHEGIAARLPATLKSLKTKDLRSHRANHGQKKPADFRVETFFRRFAYYSYGASSKGPALGGLDATLGQPGRLGDRNAALGGKQREARNTRRSRDCHPLWPAFREYGRRGPTVKVNSSWLAKIPS